MALGTFLMLCTLCLAGRLGVGYPTTRGMVFLGYFFLNSRKLNLAYGAVNDLVVRADLGASRVNFVFYTRTSRSMSSELIYLTRFKHFVALGTFLMLCALCLARSFGICNPTTRDMVFLGYFFLNS